MRITTIISKCVTNFYNYQKMNVKKNTLRNYEYILRKSQNHFNDIELSSITSDGILSFMVTVSDGSNQNTKKFRFTLLSVFFNYIHNSIDPDFQNPGHNAALRKLFRAGKLTQFKILEKNVVDEIIFRTQNPMNRLLLELMARGCMRVGEVLKLTPKDFEDRKAVIRDPKSGRESEVVFLPQKVLDQLKKYIRDNGIKQVARIFPFTYAAARLVVKNAGDLVDIYLKPHDHWKHAATYASRSGTPFLITLSIKDCIGFHEKIRK